MQRTTWTIEIPGGRRVRREDATFNQALLTAKRYAEKTGLTVKLKRGTPCARA